MTTQSMTKPWFSDSNCMFPFFHLEALQVDSSVVLVLTSSSKSYTPVVFGALSSPPASFPSPSFAPSTLLTRISSALYPVSVVLVTVFSLVCSHPSWLNHSESMD